MLMGNIGCVVVVYMIVINEKDGVDSEMFVLEGVVLIEDGLGFAFKLALWTSFASIVVKYGEFVLFFGVFFVELLYGKVFGMIVLFSVVWMYYVFNFGANASKLTM